jgi:septal ring factor EnvC (AmiA/AmiB activator)
MRAAVALVLALVAVPCLAQGERDIEARRRDLSEMEERLNDLRQDLDARRGSREVLLGELERHERDIAQLALAGRELQSMLEEQARVLANVQQRRDAQREAVARERAALAGLLRSAYALGGTERLRMLLDQEDVARMGRLLAYYEYLNRDRIRRIDVFSGQARRLEDLRREAAEETRRLAALAARQEETRRRLAAAQDRRAGLLAELDRSIAGRQESLVALEADAHALRSLLEQLERQAMALPEADVAQVPMERLRGRLAWPLEDGLLAGRFGRLKGDGGPRWDGVLIAAPEGTTVRAVHDGRVAYADWLRGFGLLVILEHDDGYMTLYGQNQALLKEQGEWVAAGDPIALSGTSGGQRTPGLYFAIRHHGRPLDPEQWCAGGTVRQGAASPPAQDRLAVAERRADSPIQPPVDPARGGRCAAGS